MRIHVEYDWDSDADECEFVVEHVASVFELTSDHEPVCVGRVWFDRVLASSASAAGRSLEDVCDESSDGLYECYRLLFDGAQDDVFPAPELGVGEPVTELLFEHRAVWHPVSTAFQPVFFCALAELFECGSLTIAWRKAVTAPDAELAPAGLMKIAGSDALYKANAYACEMSRDGRLPETPLPTVSEVVAVAPLRYVDRESRRGEPR